MKSVEEIRKVLDKVQPLVNEGDPEAEIIWDSLQWVLGEETDDPAAVHLGE